MILLQRHSGGSDKFMLCLRCFITVEQRRVTKINAVSMLLHYSDTAEGQESQCCVDVILTQRNSVEVRYVNAVSMLLYYSDTAEGQESSCCLYVTYLELHSVWSGN